jgi:hypothetical protein
MRPRYCLREVLHDAELVALGIGHHDHDPVGIVVPLIERPPAELDDPRPRAFDVPDDEVEVQTRLAPLRFPDRLERDRRLRLLSDEPAPAG